MPQLQPIPGDNAPAIAAALATGYCELVPKAPYPINSMITVANVNGPILNANGASLIALPTMPNNLNLLLFQACQNVLIDSLGIGGNGKVRGAANSHNICLNWCKNVTIRRSALRDSCGDCLLAWGGLNNEMGSCEGIRVIDCELSSPGRNCISWVHTLYTMVQGCEFNDTGAGQPAAGVDLESNGGDPSGCNMYATVIKNTFNQCWHAVYAQNIAGTNPSGLTCSENVVNGGRFGIESQWSAGLIEKNKFNGTASFPICTGSYPSSIGSRVVGNEYNNCPVPNALDARDVVV